MDYKDSLSYDENKDACLRDTCLNNYSSLNYYTGHLQKAFYNVFPTVSSITKKMFVYVPSIPRDTVSSITRKMSVYVPSISRDMITMGYNYTGIIMSPGLHLLKGMKSFTLLPIRIESNIHIHIHYNQKKESNNQD